MIEKHFVFPEYYIVKVPLCDDCKVRLHDNNLMIATNPPQWQYSCPQCNKVYTFSSEELKGEWKFKAL